MNNVRNINELNIHDSIIIKTEIKNGVVTIHLDYIEDYEAQTSSFRKLVFEECRRVDFKMNPKMDSLNSLLSAEETSKDIVRCIRIETNTTAGVIKIECEKIFISEAQSQ